jgi:dihydroorotase
LIKKKAADHLVSVDPVAAVSVGREGEVLAPMAELIDAGAVAFSDDGTAVKTAQLLRFALEYAKMYNAPISEHAEDTSLAEGAMNEGLNSTTFGIPGIPSIAEDIIVSRDIQVARYTGGHIHIGHISTKNAVHMVREAKKKGIKVTCEATPHHFTLTDDSLAEYDTNYKMNPPLRSIEDREAIIEGLKDGTIDCIASDHAPHSIEDKEKEFIYAPNGIIGLETALGLTLTELFHTNILSLEQIIEKFAYNPRKILNLELPAIKVGKKANITIFLPDEEWTVDKREFKSKSRNTPFDGYILRGKPVAAINNGKMFHNGSFSAI